MDILFARPDLIVRSVRSFASDTCVVTFDSYTDVATLERPGFGEGFFHSRGVDAIHVVARTNVWYLYEYLGEALDAVRNATEGYRRVITYGSSMGGYAAIRFGGRVGARTAIAMSPQYSVNPEAPPFERRWEYNARSIEFALEGRFDEIVPTVYLFYDPLNPDRKQADCYRAVTSVIAVPVVGGGHPCATLLGEAGLLQAMVLDIVNDCFDPVTFGRQLRKDRRRSPHLYYNTSFNLFVRKPELALGLARRAVELDPDITLFTAHLAATLMRTGRWDEAKQVLDRALAREPAHIVAQYHSSEYLEHCGDLDGAVAIIDRLLLAHPQAGALEPRLHHLLDLQVEALCERLDDSDVVYLAEAAPTGP